MDSISNSKGNSKGKGKSKSKDFDRDGDSDKGRKRSRLVRMLKEEIILIRNKIDFELFVNVELGLL